MIELESEDSHRHSPPGPGEGGVNSSKFRRSNAARLVCAGLLAVVTIGFGQVDSCPAAEKSSPQEEDLSQMSLEQLMSIQVENVVTASKFQQKVTEAPAAVTVITADEIKHYGYRTLADILRSVRGFFVTYDRNYNFIGVRGFNRPGDYNSRILLLVDGHRLNDNIFGQAPIGTDFPIDVDLIDRVEIVRGPGSSLYGANAFFAVINVLTRTGENLQGVEMSGAAGDQDSYKGRISYGGSYPQGVSTLLSGSYADSAGERRLYYPEFDDPSSNNGLALNMDRDRYYNIFSSTSWHGLTLTGVYSNREKVVPTAAFGTVFNDNRNQTQDERAYLDLKYDRRINDDTALLVRAGYDYNYYQGDYLYEDAGEQTLNRDKSYGAWLTGEVQLSRKIFRNNIVTGGTEVRYNLRQEQRNFDLDPPFTYLDDNHHGTEWALFIQDEWRLFAPLVLNVGVRYDHYPTFGGTTNPRAALIYTPWEKTVLKALYGEAFRAPNAYELYYQDSINTVANPSLQPEKIRTYELVYEQYLGEHLRTSLSGYWYQIDNLITPDDNLPSMYQNLGSVDAKGVEVEVEGRWQGDFSCRASYAYGNAKNDDTGDRLNNSPRHLAILNATAPLFTDRLLMGAEVRYIGSRTTLGGNKVKGKVVTNLTLFSRDLLKNLELSGSIYNLFDTHYGDPGSIEHPQDVIAQDGRVYRIKLSYRF